MFQLPPFPSWDALHPTISHFPIALLLVAPLCLLAGLWYRDQRRAFALAALGLLATGTFSVYLSASTGDAARDVTVQSPEVKAAIEAHESLGADVRAVYTVLTALLAVLLFAPGLARRELTSRELGAGVAVVLVLCVIAGLILVNTAHTGGLLVHKLAVHARIQ